jgi:hypothetical protein
MENNKSLNTMSTENYLESDQELEKIFSKHLVQPRSKKVTKVLFTDSEINRNKIDLEKFSEQNLIKYQNHFLTDDTELFNFPKEEDENKDYNYKEYNYNMTDKEETSQTNYFKKIINDTTEGGLYCSYLDSFDKMWINNSKNFII